MDYFQSLEKVILSIENNNIKTVAGKSKLSIIVESRYEIFITHYPLWNNENFLYSIGCVLNKIILEKNIPEEMDAYIYFKLKSKDTSLEQNQKYIFN